MRLNPLILGREFGILYPTEQARARMSQVADLHRSRLGEIRKKGAAAGAKVRAPHVSPCHNKRLIAPR